MHAVLALLILLPQDDVTREQKRVREMLEKLRATIERVIERSTPDQADKLRAALKKLRLDGPEIHVDAVLAELKANRMENALREGQTVEALLEAILAILEDRTDPKAVERIESWLRELREIREAQEKRPGDPKAQRALEERTRELGKKIEGSASRALGRAGDAMKGAGNDLENGRDARENQDRALEELKRAEEDLKEELEERKREADQGRILALEEELKKAIARQEYINRATLDLETIRVEKGSFTRRQITETRMLAGSQSDLAEFLDEIRRVLKEENVEVYRYVLESAIEDMKESAERLNESDTAERTLEVQADAVRKLKDLLEAFVLKRREMRRAPGDPGNGPGRPPRVPDVVQLSLMKKMQEELYRKTVAFQKRYRRDREDLSDPEKAVLRRLSDEQGRLREVLVKYIEKFERSKP